ncbi:MAG TPA: hypothetical protein VM901_05800 [Bdellovibrionota bacterium]|jgi:hypothetical protein|nr:hypothetical protein [Bdellovibrionota bacterium]
MHQEQIDQTFPHDIRDRTDVIRVFYPGGGKATFVFLALFYPAFFLLLMYSLIFLSEDLWLVFKIPFALVISYFIYGHITAAALGLKGSFVSKEKAPFFAISDKELIFRDYVESNGNLTLIPWENIRYIKTGAMMNFPARPQGYTKYLSFLDENKSVLWTINLSYWSLPIDKRTFVDYLVKEFSLTLLGDRKKLYSS